MHMNEEELLEKYFNNRKNFAQFISSVNQPVVLKFTAEWCGPCKQIEPLVSKYFSNLINKNYICLTIDIEESFDVYMYLKSKKMVSAVPTILYYSKDNTCCYAPSNSVVGANEKNVNDFFQSL